MQGNRVGWSRNAEPSNLIPSAEIGIWYGGRAPDDPPLLPTMPRALHPRRSGVRRRLPRVRGVASTGRQPGAHVRFPSARTGGLPPRVALRDRSLDRLAEAGTRSRAGSAAPALQSKPVTPASRLVARSAPSVASGLGGGWNPGYRASHLLTVLRLSPLWAPISSFRRKPS